MSYVSADSWTWLEEFLTARRFGTRAGVRKLPARRVEAFAVLESEMESLEQERDG